MRPRLLTLFMVLGTALLPIASSAQHEGPAMNFVRIDDRLATGGHLTDGGLETLRSDGVKVVIDLRDEPPDGQRERLAAQGIQWINVPVAWSSPKQSDFELFRAAMREHGGDNVLVQCQANYRASAMTYLYRVLEDGVPEAVARRAMNEVWEPSGTWKAFIDGLLESSATR